VWAAYQARQRSQSKAHTYFLHCKKKLHCMMCVRKVLDTNGGQFAPEQPARRLCSFRPAATEACKNPMRGTQRLLTVLQLLQLTATGSVALRNVSLCQTAQLFERTPLRVQSQRDTMFFMCL